jgi:polysaccharide export outer membrane protein
VAYISTVVASGGSGGYRFAIASGALPGGLAINPANGIISGTPTADGTFTYTVQVTDSAGATAATGGTPCMMQPPVAPAPGGGTVNPASQPAAAPPGAPAGMAPAETDPAKLAGPRDKAIARAAQGLPQDDHPYILGAEDQISVLVYGSPEFSGAHMIRPDGKITMPFIGDLTAAGLAPVELMNSVKERLRKYIVDPDVSVQVNAVNSKRYFIQGEVNRPGESKLLVPTRVLEALVNAGGFRDFANQKNIVIMRLNGERLKFNYKEVIRGKKMDQNIYLKPGDIIIVK